MKVWERDYTCTWLLWLATLATRYFWIYNTAQADLHTETKNTDSLLDTLSRAGVYSYQSLIVIFSLYLTCENDNYYASESHKLHLHNTFKIAFWEQNTIILWTAQITTWYNMYIRLLCHVAIMPPILLYHTIPTFSFFAVILACIIVEIYTVLIKYTWHCSVCHYRNSSLKTRLSDLQKMVSELAIAQREYEEYAHMMEQTTKYVI